ncbi:phosphoserine phosphatase SerB [Erythrobacter sp. SDW2]|uniref:phosphoserine phosphatase SerB n=1 Tax=Erythrobacter sp. SDW2 TaxID=2907154 RepID=UPI001F24A7C9|nr:phosphoserine phosphatase SerB [Erythrobacter sp. SDW2]UIP05893.1 phosphoserine phosphatase SerB [Erythrobacter sp. SDW2]
MLIARLIADPDGLLSRIEALKHALEPEGLALAVSAEAIPEGVLVQIETFSGSTRLLRAALDEHFPGTDGLIVDERIALPQVFVSDMDSTMIGQECIDELADYAGIKPQIAEITERAMQGELDFESALRERVALLAGLEESAIQRCLDERIQPNPGARVLVGTLRRLGCKTVLVTGGFHHFADPVAEGIGFDRVIANRLDVANGALTGGLVGPVVDSAVKRSALLDAIAEAGQGAFGMAAGDGANDISMLEAAHCGVAYHAKPKARGAADCWIDRGDLSSILVLLGIPRDEWVVA